MNDRCRVRAGSILGDTIQTAFNRRLTIAQRAFNRQSFCLAR
nr:MAG TPA: hypothetical protein [Caudoviricetes sp.]